MGQEKITDQEARLAIDAVDVLIRLSQMEKLRASQDAQVALIEHTKLLHTWAKEKNEKANR